jgi:hypothetical protein
MRMAKREASIAGTSARRLAGQASIGPSDVRDQSMLRMSAALSPPCVNRRAKRLLVVSECGCW